MIIKNNTSIFIKLVMAYIILILCNSNIIFLNKFQPYVFPMVIFLAYLVFLDKEQLKIGTNKYLAIIFGVFTGLVNYDYIYIYVILFYMIVKLMYIINKKEDIKFKLFLKIGILIRVYSILISILNIINYDVIFNINNILKLILIQICINTLIIYLVFLQVNKRNWNSSSKRYYW